MPKISDTCGYFAFPPFSATGSGYQMFIEAKVGSAHFLSGPPEEVGGGVWEP